MKNQRDEYPGTSIFRSSHSDADAHPVDNAGRREPAFGRFGDSSHEEYEEPERDTDYFSGYNDDEHLEEEQDDLFSHEDEEPVAEVANGASWSSHTPEADAAPSAEEDAEDQAWLDEEEGYELDEPAGTAMPLRLIAVAVVALLLLTVGAYGVLQERAAMQEELLELRAALATGVSESDLADAREALRELQASYDTLAAQSSALSGENNQLKEAVAALEAQQAAAEAGAEAPVAE